MKNVILIFVALLAAIPAWAASLTWSGGATGDWDQSTANWNSGTTNWNNSNNDGKGDTASFTANATVTLTEDINVTGNQSKGINRTGGTITINSTDGAALNLWAGVNAPSGTVIINAPVVLRANISMAPDNGGGATWNGVISGAYGFTGSFSGGTTYLNADNTFTGNINTMHGFATTYSIYVDKLAATGTAQPLGMNNTFIWNVGGTSKLIYTGSANAVTDKSWRLGFGTDSGGENMWFVNDGTGTVTWTGEMLNDTQAGTGPVTRRLNLGGSNTGDNTWQSVLKDRVAFHTFVTALDKEDAGKWILTGDNTYTGTTRVNAGTLVINGNQSGATGTVTVASGATLGGTGLIGGKTVSINGTLSPGTSDYSVGTLTVSNSLTLAENSIYKWEYDGAAGDLIECDTLTLPLAMTVNVARLGGDFASEYVLMSATNLTGATNLSGWEVPDGYAVTIRGNEVVIVRSRRIQLIGNLLRLSR